MKLFSVDGGLYKFMQSLTTVFKVNMLWLLCSLPIVTLGAATIAAYDVTLRMVDDEEGYVGRQFFKAFKANLKRGIPLGLLFLFCIYVVWLDFSLFEQIEGNPMILLIMGFVSAYIFALAFIYAFPLQARYENTLVRTLQNSFNISIKYFVRTLFTIILVAFEVVIIFWNSTTLFFGIIIGPAFIMYTISACAKFIFRELEREPGAVSNPEQK